MTISFRAGNNYPPQNIQQKNSIGLTENGQKILNKTNGILNTYSQINMAYEVSKEKDFSKRAKGVGELLKNSVTMDLYANPVIGSSYVVDQYKKGNISKDEAKQIIATNAITLLNAMG